MKKLTILLCIFTLMCLCWATLAVELDPDKFMTVDKIKPGMKGIGKTVFEGTRIDEFQIEVLEVVKNAIGPKGDIIWVMCSGGNRRDLGHERKPCLYRRQADRGGRIPFGVICQTTNSRHNTYC